VVVYTLWRGINMNKKHPAATCRGLETEFFFVLKTNHQTNHQA
jgi:hypothetical protein